jgi:hypothetical protein
MAEEDAMNTAQLRSQDKINASNEGLVCASLGGFYREIRRQAIHDHPILRQLAPLLKTPQGQRMHRLDRIAFAAELLLLKKSVRVVAANARLDPRTVRYLRSRLITAGLMELPPNTRKYAPPIPKDVIERFLQFPLSASVREVARAMKINEAKVCYLRRRHHRGRLKTPEPITPEELAAYASYPAGTPLKRIARGIGIPVVRADTIRRMTRRGRHYWNWRRGTSCQSASSSSSSSAA